MPQHVAAQKQPCQERRADRGGHGQEATGEGPWCWETGARPRVNSPSPPSRGAPAAPDAAALKPSILLIFGASPTPYQRGGEGALRPSASRRRGLRSCPVRAGRPLRRLQLRRQLPGRGLRRRPARRPARRAWRRPGRPGRPPCLARERRPAAVHCARQCARPRPRLATHAASHAGQAAQARGAAGGGASAAGGRSSPGTPSRSPPAPWPACPAAPAGPAPCGRPRRSTTSMTPALPKGSPLLTT